MEKKGSRSTDHRIRLIVLFAAALVLIGSAVAAAFLYAGGKCWLILKDPGSGREYARYAASYGDTFSVTFVHSVNRSPVSDIYEIKDDGIYVEQTVYYNFGAGVQTELGEGETRSYGEDGSMIVSGFDRKIEPLLYIVGTVSDHVLVINEGEEISLRDLCGRSAHVEFCLRRRIGL